LIPNFDKVHNRFRLNGNRYNHEDLKEVAYSYIKEGLPFEKIIGDFLMDWLNDESFISVKTSGSTGNPKTIQLQKQAMVNSALATGNYFGLEPGNRALHCLPTKFVAGKMMLVRAMILGLELDIVEPTSQPIFDHEIQYDFCAMIPLQLSKTINYVQNISTIIVGGAPVSKDLKFAIKDCSTNIFETYGMTETITHIAIKKLNNFMSLREGTTKQSVSGLFHILPNIIISQDKRDCLVIEAPHLSKDKIITNDVVQLHSDAEFEWLGRFDNVINSGGIKIHPEQLEAKLQDKILQRFFIASESDNVLGNRVVLIIEDQSATIKSSVFSDLLKHETPKQIYAVAKFVETVSGKIQRQKTLQKAKA